MGGGGRRGWSAGGRGRNRQLRKEKSACNWFAAGFCVFADKCRARGATCCDSQRILDLEDAWLAGNDPPLAADEIPLTALRVTDNEGRSPEEVECLLVLDIEGGANIRPGQDEIIELPVTIVNLKTAAEEGRFHRFIRPTSWDRLLSDAAGSARLNNRSSAVPFRRAMVELEQWLLERNIILDACSSRSQPAGNGRGGRLFLWATCGDWDLKTVVPRQCGKSEVPVPKSMAQWCNLKAMCTSSFTVFGDIGAGGDACALILKP